MDIRVRRVRKKKRTRAGNAGLAFVFLLFLPAVFPAAAQEPSSVQPGQVIRRFDSRPVFESVPVPRSAPVPAIPAPPGRGLRFMLKGVTLEGSTVYGADDVAAMARDIVGKETDFAALSAHAGAMTARYRADGWLLSRVTLEPQEIPDGVVRFTAVEGYVSDVRFEGATENLKDAMEAARASLLASRPLRAAALERALLLLDDLPDVTTQALFRPAETGAGASVLVVTLAREEWEGELTLGNRGSRYLGPVELTGRASAGGVLGPLSRTTLRGVVSVPADELRFWDLAHELPLGARGLRAAFRAAFSNSEPGGPVSGLGISGESGLLEVRLSYPFLRARNRTLRGYVAAQALNASGDLLGAPAASDRIRAARLGGTLDFSDSYAGANLVDAHLRRGFGAFGATREGAGRSRVNGAQDFTTLHLSVSRVQQLPAGFSAAASVAGQYAPRALLAPQEFALGGADLGRAYDAAEVTGDSGLGGTLELRYSGVLGLRARSLWQVYGFYDAGRVWNRDIAALESARESLASAGGGLRLDLAGGFDADFEVAVPLTRPVSAEGGDSGPRLFFRIGKTF